MPTGVALRDARRQLLDAAARVLLRDGPSALTSRAVTAEAGVAKGVIHRHFTDFDAFLAQFVLDQAGQLDPVAAALPAAAGTGTVAGNIAAALGALFSSAAVAIVALVDFRDELRSRLHESWPAGVPVLTQAMELIASYLAAEQDRGRIADSTDIETLSAVLMGAGHRMFAGRPGAPPDSAAVIRMVTAVIAGVVREPAP